MSLKNVSLKSIASELNVSVNTVSHALRDMDDISAEMKEKVIKKAIELGYMPNRVAQKMHKDEKPLIAILIDSLTNLYFNTFINEFIKLLSLKGEYDFMLLYASELNKDTIKQCVLQRADLLITHMPFKKEVYEYAKFNNIGILFVGSSIKEDVVDNVTVDNFKGCILAAHRLESIKDGNKYLYVGIDYFLSAHRYSIFKTELQEVAGEKDVCMYNYNKEDISVLYNYIENGFRKIFFYNDMLAYEVMAKLDNIYGRGVRKMYPDIHIIGFDGLSGYVFGFEDIDSVKINFFKLAEATFNVMENRFEKPDSKIQRIVLPVSLHLKKET